MMRWFVLLRHPHAVSPDTYFQYIIFFSSPSIRKAQQSRQPKRINTTLDAMYTIWYNNFVMQDNRARILQAALDLFSTKGYDSTGIQEIIDAVGITKPTLYHYFGSKEGLVRELLNTHFGAFNARLRESSYYAGDLVNTLEKLTGSLFDFATKNKGFYLFYTSMLFTPKESESGRIIDRYVRENTRIIEEMFIRAGEHHGNLKGRQKAYTISFLGMMNGYILSSFDGECTLDAGLVHRAVKQFLYGIFA